MSLTQIAFILFAAIAAGGLTMAGLIAAGIRIPSFIGPGHGLGGLVAVVTLLAANVKGADATPAMAWWALAVFAGGMLGGFVLFRVLFKNKATLPLVAVHASAGAIGLYLLYGAAF